jgi:hypothetical protein
MLTRLAPFLIVLVSSASADITINVTAKALGPDFGYQQDDIATFVFTLNPGDFSSNVSGNFFSSANNRWGDEAVSELPTFTNVTGTGLGGAWVRPTLNTNDPYSLLVTVDDGMDDVFGLIAGDDGGYGIGLTAGTHTLGKIQIDATRLGLNFNFTGTYTDPTAYFNSLLGPYVATTGTLQLWDIDQIAHLSFSVQSVTIGAIPEPSTAASLVGLAALAVATRRRRKR